MPKFDGPDYDPVFDAERLNTQLRRIYNLMIDGSWRTLSEIASVTGDHESSISAQLRHLRKPKHGSHVVNKQRRGDPAAGLYEYQVLSPVPKAERQLEMQFN